MSFTPHQFANSILEIAATQTNASACALAQGDPPKVDAPNKKANWKQILLYLSS